jgi:hypothetical protein
VLPGESLTVSMWRQRGSDTVLFQTTREDGVVVIDRGLFQGGYSVLRQTPRVRGGHRTR